MMLALILAFEDMKCFQLPVFLCWPKAIPMLKFEFQVHRIATISPLKGSLIAGHEVFGSCFRQSNLTLALRVLLVTYKLQI